MWDQRKVAAGGKFTHGDFRYERSRDVYICPGGNALKISDTAHDGATLKYIARRSDCGRFSLKGKCTSGTQRRLQRDINQDARAHTKELMRTEAYEVSACERKKIETLFSEAKHQLGLTRVRLRGLTGARDEFLLTATVQNLKRLVRHAAIPPPTGLANA